jgi:hypothetical protein
VLVPSAFHTSCQVFTLPVRFSHFLSVFHTSCWIITLHSRFSHFPSGFPFLSDFYTSCQHCSHPRERIYFRRNFYFSRVLTKKCILHRSDFFLSFQIFIVFVFVLVSVCRLDCLYTIVAQVSTFFLDFINVHYHSRGSMKLNACILFLAHMVYL